MGSKDIYSMSVVGFQHAVFHVASHFAIRKEHCTVASTDDHNKVTATTLIRHYTDSSLHLSKFSSTGVPPPELFHSAIQNSNLDIVTAVPSGIATVYETRSRQK